MSLASSTVNFTKHYKFNHCS